MDRESIAAMAVMLVCCWGCGALFFGIGIWAAKRKTPMHFWAGTEPDPNSVSDVRGYNHENAVMWKVYSIPYWLSGLFSLFGSVSHVFSVVSLILIVLACFPGLPMLIRRYKQIERKYIC